MMTKREVQASILKEAVEKFRRHVSNQEDLKVLIALSLLTGGVEKGNSVDVIENFSNTVDRQLKIAIERIEARDPDEMNPEDGLPLFL